METRKRDTDTPQKRHSYTRNWCDFASVCMYTHKRDVYVYVRPRRYIVPFYIDTHLCRALQSGKPALHIFVHTAFIYLYMYICMYIYVHMYIRVYILTRISYFRTHIQPDPPKDVLIALWPSTDGYIADFQYCLVFPSLLQNTEFKCFSLL